MIKMKILKELFKEVLPTILLTTGVCMFTIGFFIVSQNSFELFFKSEGIIFLIIGFVLISLHVYVDLKRKK